jgi:hypothetical protein
MRLRERLTRLEKHLRQRRVCEIKPVEVMTDEELCALIARGTSHTAEDIAAMSDAELAVIVATRGTTSEGDLDEIRQPHAPPGTRRGQITAHLR